MWRDVMWSAKQGFSKGNVEQVLAWKSIGNQGKGYIWSKVLTWWMEPRQGERSDKAGSLWLTQETLSKASLRHQEGRGTHLPQNSPSDLLTVQQMAGNALWLYEPTKNRDQLGHKIQMWWVGKRSLASGFISMGLRSLSKPIAMALFLVAGINHGSPWSYRFQKNWINPSKLFCALLLRLIYAA